MVFVEIDRCATDAIQSVTGCSLGRRTLKHLDYGKMAATFMNLRTGAAKRVIAREDSRQKAREYFPGIENSNTAQLEAYKIMADEELFEVMNIAVAMRPEDMPGKPLRRIRCSLCGEHVQDGREVDKGGEIVCRPCAGDGYYERTNRIFLSRVMQESHNGIEIRSKVWLEREKEPVFGRGRMFLLQGIEKSGSINQAAKRINLSYRKAWSYIKAMEERLGIKLVDRRAGGKNGGGAVLTEDARHFLKKYEALEKGIQDIVDERFSKVFKGGSHV
jgi:formylmethanofuran dehydrogenase subunit E